MSSETLIYEKEDFEEGSMVTLTMNKPETLNALNIEFSREIDEALTMSKWLLSEVPAKRFQPDMILGVSTLYMAVVLENRKIRPGAPVRGRAWRMTAGVRKACGEYSFWIK
jgi:hypothetical protein